MEHIYLIILLVTFDHCFAGITSQWDECGCEWVNWESWDDCSEECNGVKIRYRNMRLYTHKEGCKFEFETCASYDMRDDYSRCNTFCHNGGTSDGYRCDCVPGFYGSCCGHQVTCGNPGSIAYGRLHGSQYTYDATVSYSCNANYKLVGYGSMRCNIHGYWTGAKPRCAYFNSCSSSPCQHRGRCTNIPDDYKCTCTTGWSGKNCEVDILPPIVKNCPANIDKRTERIKQQIEWQEPEFSDPHGLFDVAVSRSYPNNSFSFPWGDFTVSYSAVKTSNGLRTECEFKIKVRPNSCPKIDIPENGAVVCNNWKTDYGQICLLFCEEFFTVARGINPNDWFVCGASGSWRPSSSMPNCTVWSLPPKKEYNIASMYEQVQRNNTAIRTQYIAKLNQSHLKYFCEKFKSECKQENVSIRT